jgi:predicted SprT family Zn-dependent metalloprotease
MTDQQKREKQREKEYQAFLLKVKKVFEPRYGEILEGERLENIAKNIMQYACICHNAYSKRIGKKPIYAI